jgi:cell wall-associated NlpC family hydrolase
MRAPSEVVAAAREWIGVPFRHQGRNRAGIDCVGLPIVIGQSLGIFDQRFDVANYDRLASPQLAARVREHCTPAPEAAPGTLIVIAWSKIAAHVAICTGETMIHAYESVGRVVEHGYRGRWIKLTHSIWRLPGVAYE